MPGKDHAASRFFEHIAQDRTLWNRDSQKFAPTAFWSQHSGDQRDPTVLT